MAIKSNYKHSNFKFINFYCDFETILVNNIHYASCFSIVGPQISYYKSLNLSCNMNIKETSNQLILDFIYACRELKQRVDIDITNKVLFLFHNFNKFDSFFIINSLSNLKNFKINLISRNKTIYKMIVVFLLLNFQLEFRDTYLLLNLSLKKIGYIFCSKFKKIEFDYSLNKIEIYQNKKKFCDLVKKIEIYCINDSLLLKEGFEFFIREIKQILFINPLFCLSLPSLAMKIYLKKFYNSQTGFIENCKGNKEIFIRKSYKGGMADVYYPCMEEGYHYDVNSLYPFVMKEFSYPVGYGTFVKSNSINLDI